ncbi:MAG TPA: PAS domain S-box protein [Reyranella sp.]|nr:PAS domain S-box protein [Reyranella sp.]
MAPTQAFIPAYQAVLMFSDLATAALLFGQFSIQRTRGLLVLATAYLFTGLATVPHTLSFPGLVPSALIGSGPQTTVWLYVIWHAGFPLLTVLYALVKDNDRPIRGSRRAGWLAALAAVAAVLAGTLITTRGHAILPPLLKPDLTYTDLMYGVIYGVWALNLVSLAVLLTRRPYRTLDLWMIVVTVAWIGDVGLSAAFNAKRFDLGFYAGRAYGLVAAAFVLGVLLLETRSLYARLAGELVSDRDSAERRARRMFETSQDLILVTDTYGHVTEMSPSSERVLGISPQEMLGRLASDFIHPDDVEPTRQEMRSARQGNATRNFLCRYMHRDGRAVPLRWTGVWSESDRLHFFIGRDVSEIEAKEAQVREARRVSQETAEVLRAVVDTSYQAVIALAPEGNILLWNKAAERIFGYAAAEVVGRPYPRRSVDAAEEAEQRDWIARVMAGETLANLSFRRLTKDGDERALYGAAAPFYDSQGKLRGAAYVLEDVTDKLRTEDELRQLQKMEAVGQLTGGVAHDFNNILMVILANVEELQESDNLTDDQREMLASISASGERAAEMTKRLLAFSRKQRLNPQPTNITELVKGIDKLLRRTLGEQIRIDSVFGADLWTTNVDRSQVEAALVNLCVNARDAMPNGGRLTLETGNAELDRDYADENPGTVPGQYVMLAVSDTGTGIPPELLAKVFEPFFTTKEVGKGTGLGLSMVYGFIKQSNGHIKIYSEVGHGTTIRMYLPRSDVPAEGAAMLSATAPRGSERVLLVEDDDQVRGAVVRQLRGLGYVVTEASGGEAALGILESGARFDLVLSDTVMPGLDGPGLIKITRQRWPDMKVLLMSGYSEHASRNRGTIIAGVQMLSKPFRRIDLAAKLRETLDAPQAAAARVDA